MFKSRAWNSRSKDENIMTLGRRIPFVFVQNIEKWCKQIKVNNRHEKQDISSSAIMVSTLMMRVTLPKSDEIFCVTSFHSPPQQKQQLLTQDKNTYQTVLEVQNIYHFTLCFNSHKLWISIQKNISTISTDWI